MSSLSAHLSTLIRASLIAVIAIVGIAFAQSTTNSTPTVDAAGTVVQPRTCVEYRGHTFCNNLGIGAVTLVGPVKSHPWAYGGKPMNCFSYERASGRISTVCQRPIPQFANFR